MGSWYHVEYDKAYAPFWEGTTVYNESCVFIKGEDGKITLKTMFTPTKVIAVRDSTLEILIRKAPIIPIGTACSR